MVGEVLKARDEEHYIVKVCACGSPFNLSLFDIGYIGKQRA